MKKNGSPSGGVKAAGVRLLALMLAFSALLCFTACDRSDDAIYNYVYEPKSEADEPPAESAELSAETSDDKPQQPSGRAAEKYGAAVEALAAMTSQKLRINMTTERHVGANTGRVRREAVLLYKGMGTDGFTAYITDKSTVGDDYWTTKRYYADGRYTCFTGGSTYYTEMSADDFLARQTPAALLTAGLYDISFGGDEKTLVFENASALEPWLATEYAVLSSASGTVKLKTSGEIDSFEYNAVYKRGPVEFEVKCSAAVSSPSDADRFEGPEKEGERFENADVLDTAKTACLLAQGAFAFEMNSTKSLYSEAGGISANVSEQYLACGTNADDLEIKTSAGVSQYDSVNGQYDIKSESRYKGGVLSTDRDGQTTAEDCTVEEVLKSAFFDLNTARPDRFTAKSLEVSDYGEYLYISYSLGEKACEYYEKYVNSFFYSEEDRDRLEERTDLFSPKKAEGYICIDRDAGYLTALGLEYAGTRTVDGEEYGSGLTLTLSFAVGGVGTYSAVKGSLPEADAPEEKPTPLFYKLTSPEGGVLYLLGTVHVGDSAACSLPDEVYAALDGADVLVVETDVLELEDRLENDPALRQKAVDSYMYADGSTADKHLADDGLYKAGLCHALASGLSSAVARLMTPAAWSSCITGMYLKSDPSISEEYGIDRQLLLRAYEKGPDISELETPEETLDRPFLYDDDVHEMLLRSALGTTRSEYLSSVHELYSLWCEGDEETLAQYLADSASTDGLSDAEKAALDKYNDIVDTSRTAKMAEKASICLESGQTAFFAVGLAHVLGEHGLLQALADYSPAVVTFR